MNIIEKYIETNKSLLDDLVANDPTLATGVIDALAVLNNYINANNIEFTEQEETKILVPANIEEIKREEERIAKELQLAEEKSKEIEEAIKKIDESDLNNQNCTYVFVRDWFGNKLNWYFILGVTNDAKAETILFFTFLKDDVFTNNPTPANKLVREQFISKSRLRYLQLGTWIWKLADYTIKSPKVNTLDWRSQIRELKQDSIGDFTPRLLIDNNRLDAIKIFLHGSANHNDYENLMALEKPYYLNYALNTIQLVAWAEGISLGLNNSVDLLEFGKYLDSMVKESKKDNQRLYVVLARDTQTKESEMRSAFGSTLAEQLVKSYKENDAFVVAILVDGAFQDGIDPYMFSQANTQQTIATPSSSVPSIPPTTSTMTREEAEARDRAIKASKITTEKCYVVELQNGKYGMEVGDEDAITISESEEFEGLVAVYQDGLLLEYGMIPTPIELHEEITEEDLKDLEPIELHIKNKEALKTDFSLLEDINFDDEE